MFHPLVNSGAWKLRWLRGAKIGLDLNENDHTGLGHMSTCTDVACSQGAALLELDATASAKLRARVQELEQRAAALQAARDDAQSQLRAAHEVPCAWGPGVMTVRC